MQLRKEGRKGCAKAGQAGASLAATTWQKGDAVFAEVRDTGSGITKEHLPQLFEPFSTTKEIGTGTEQGLSVSKTIVEGYGGHIEVESEVGKGTSFVVRLPVTKAEAQDEVTQLNRAFTELNLRGRILLIDDEAGIRATMTRMLRGYQVVETASGEEARAILETDQAFDVILCDMMMPGMSGPVLHKWLYTVNPDLAKRVMFITGGAFTPKAREYLATVDNIQLEKPFDVLKFKKLVAEMIAT